MTSTKDRIAEATLTLISEGGLNGVTMIEVARTAGIARQTLYNHYPDVDSIVADALERHIEASVEQLRAAVAVVETSTDKITQLVRYVAQMSNHGRTVDVVGSLAPKHRGSLGGLAIAIDAVVATCIQSGKRDGSFRSDLDPAIDTALVRHVLDGVSELVADTPQDQALIAAAGTRMILLALVGG